LSPAAEILVSVREYQGVRPFADANRLGKCYSATLAFYANGSLGNSDVVGR